MTYNADVFQNDGSYFFAIHPSGKGNIIKQDGPFDSHEEAKTEAVEYAAKYRLGPIGFDIGSF